MKNIKNKRLRGIEEVINSIINTYIEELDIKIEESLKRGELETELKIPEIVYDFEEVRDRIGIELERNWYSVKEIKHDRDNKMIELIISIIEIE